MANKKEIPDFLAKLIESPEEALRTVMEFERKLADSQGANYGLGTSSCSTGLFASMMAIGVKEGDEVIVPSLTWGGTWSPAVLLGARLVPVDCSSRFPVIDPEKLEKSISKKTKAIVVVGLWAHAAGIAEIQQIAKEHSIPLVVDAAQLFNSKVNGKGIGTAGDFVVMSFNCTKSIMALGEGGAVLCNSKTYYERLLLITQHPVRNSFEVENMAYLNFNDGMNLNFKINPLAACIGTGKLDEYNSPQFLFKIRPFTENVKEILARHEVSELLPPESWIRAQANGTRILIDSKLLSKDNLCNLKRSFEESGVETSHCCYDLLSEVYSRREGKSFPWSKKSLKISKGTFPNSANWKDRLFIISVF